MIVIELFSLLLVFANSELIDLKQSNFDNELRSHENEKFLLVFYSPSCPHCMEFLPEIQDFSNKYQEKAIFGKINCNEEDNLADRFEINYVPTIYLISHNQAYLFGDYNERSEDNIANFIQNPDMFAVSQDIPEKVVHAGVFQHFFLKYEKQLARQSKRKLRKFNKNKQ